MGASPQSILVMGMHRSGTSCVTEVLEACGVSLGPDSDLMPPTIANPRGYFENLTFNQICIDLLQSAGADWWKISEFDLVNIPEDDLEKAKDALNRLIDDLSGAQVFALKDPRLCFLLPALRPAFPNPVFVHVVRSPIEVAMSLNERNGFGMAEGIALWEAYNRAGFAATAQESRILLNYGSLITDPVAKSVEVLESLREFGLSGLSLKNDAEITELVSSDLYRQRYIGSQASTFLTETQKQFWENLEAGHFPKKKEGAQARRNRILLLSCLEMQSKMQTVRSQERQRAEEKQRLAELSNESQSERRSAQSQEEKLSSMATDLTAAQAAISKLGQFEAEAKRDHERLRAADQEKLNEISEKLQSTQRSTQSQEEKLSSMATDLTAAQAAISKLGQFEAEAKRDHERLRAADQEKLQSAQRSAQSQEEMLSSMATDLAAAQAAISKLGQFEAEAKRDHERLRAADQEKLQSAQRNAQSQEEKQSSLVDSFIKLEVKFECLEQKVKKMTIGRQL